MKYPQLVSMPSAVSDWLEEQLDARGIDAVVYTRYVLSLLQHHHSQDEDLGEFEYEFRQHQQHAKESTAGRGRGGSANKRLRRTWFQHVVRVADDVEQLRRSAAVEALMSAAEQKCGIESLVDELCEKLKHFESNNGAATESSSSTTTSLNNSPTTTTSTTTTLKRTISPADLARKYYAAFPPLNCKSTPSKLITLIPQICTQNTVVTTTAAIATTSNSIQKRKHNHRNNRPTTTTTTQSHNHSNNFNYHRSIGGKDKSSRKTSLDHFEIMKSRSSTNKQQPSQQQQQPQQQRMFRTLKQDFGFARNMEKTSSDWDVYFLNNRMGDEGYSTSDTTGLDDTEDALEMETSHTTMVNKKIDEAHLAKLVAKFDQKIEALWSTGRQEEECEEQNEENEYHDLPVDIQELLASPPMTTNIKQTNVELLNVTNRRVSAATKPFIQCGTNITSSIWTAALADNNNENNNEDVDDERSMYDSMSFANFYNEQIEDSSYPEKILGDQFNCLSVAAAAGDCNDIYSLDKFRVAENETNLHFEQQQQQRYENSETNSFYNKFGSGATNNNTFTSLPWEIAFPNNFNNKKWSDAESYNFGEKYQSPLCENNNVTKKTRTVTDSLLTLNHNKDASCFKEVVPKQVLGLTTSFEQIQPAAAVVATTIEEDTKQEEEGKELEEDLLTSTRTHFRPIKQDDSSSAVVGNHTHYADGTTFAIRSSLEHINYRRSESGTMYLESGFDTPKKYQEYRLMKDVVNAIAVDTKTNMAAADTKSNTTAAENSINEREFVLKFCVKQNEKCCQTETDINVEEEDDVDIKSAASSQSHSPLEVPAKKRVLCDPEEFFFPGDEELLLDTVDGGAECSCASRSRLKLATNLEPLFNASTEACSLHGRDSTVAEINWPPEINWRKCDKCNNNWSTTTNHLNVNVNTAALWSNATTTTNINNNDKNNSSNNSSNSWQQIWSSSEELCRTCLGVPAGSGPPPGRSLEYFKLREELSEDGEQLLSDLSCLQRVYMEQLPSTEITCDLNELTTTTNLTTNTTTSTSTAQEVPVAPIIAVAKLFTSNNNNIIPVIGNNGGSKERKRRHSSSQRSCEPIAATVARNSWTNASCLLRPELRCLFTPPLLRPVTL